MEIGRSRCVPSGVSFYVHFDPPLQDGVNDLSFASYDDLDRTIRRAMNMSTEQVDLLRKGTTDYYHQYLDSQAFGANFRHQWQPAMHLIVNQERWDYIPD